MTSPVSSDTSNSKGAAITAPAKNDQGYHRAPLTSLTAPYQPGSDWDRVCENFIVFPPGRSRRGTKGPRSMIAACTRVLADNIRDVSFETILELPDHLKRALFRELYPRNMALQSWRALTGAFMPELSARAASASSGKGKEKESQFTAEMAVFRYNLEIGAPQCRLSAYITPFMDWTDGLIYFSIDNVPRFQTHELVALAKLRQLAVLEIVEREDRDSPVSDRLFRAWGEVEGERFPTLRVLKIASKRHQVTERALQYVLPLPSLEIFDITALRSSTLRSDQAKDVANRCGWKVEEAGDRRWRYAERQRPPEIPEKRLFVAYADAYLDGRIPVHWTGALGLKKMFEQDKQEVVWVDNPRRLLYPEEEKSRELKDEKTDTERDPGHVEPEPEKPELRDYIDDGWRSVLDGSHMLSRLAGFHKDSDTSHFDMTADQVFWFLALLDQRQGGERKPPAGQMQAFGVTLPRDRFVSFTLCDHPCGEYHSRETLYAERLIFSRSREAEARRQRASHLDNREENPQAPKPQKSKKRQGQTIADLLSSMVE